MIPFRAASSQYLYLLLTEQNGNISVNGAGASGTDGKRGDPNGSAWTSPVWLVQTAPSDLTPATFVWSKQSSVHHDPNCFVVPPIGSANRREGPPSPGQTKHACQP